MGGGRDRVLCALLCMFSNPRLDFLKLGLSGGLLGIKRRNESNPLADVGPKLS
jgi:hypothetical protein